MLTLETARILSVLLYFVVLYFIIYYILFSLDEVWSVFNPVVCAVS